MTPEELEEAEEDDRLQDFSIFEGMTAEQVARFGQPTSGCTFTLSQADYEAFEARRERDAREAATLLADRSASAKRKAQAKPKAAVTPKPKAPAPRLEDIPGRRCGWCNGLLRDRSPYGVICVEMTCFRSPLNPNIPWNPTPFVVQDTATPPTAPAEPKSVPKAKPKAPPWHNVLPPPQAPDTRYNE